MTERGFLSALRDEWGDFTYATVLEGPDAGQRLLLRAGQAVWQSKPGGVLGRAMPMLAGCTTSGILELEGARVFVERFGGTPRLVVCGGGHVAEAVTRFAVMLGLPVTGLEERLEFADALRCAGASEVLCGPFTESLARVPGGSETYFVVATPAHCHDVECLTVILQKPAAYVGMLGSKSRSGLVRRQLVEAGIDPARAEALHAPIGLAIGGQTAQEIALSILAEIVQVKNSRQQTEGFTPEIQAALGRVSGPAVLATIVARHGSTPREAGAKMLVLPREKAVGSVGGGIMEYRAQQLAARMLAGEAAPCQLVEYSASANEDDAALAACGGSMRLFLQLLTQPEGETSDET